MGVGVAAQANLFGLNVDGDAQGTIDNALGQILFTLAGQAGAAFNLQDSVDGQVRRGRWSARSSAAS